jgi:adenylate cyclase
MIVIKIIMSVAFAGFPKVTNMIEKERKFLLEAGKLKLKDAYKIRNIKQGYLMLADNQQLRIRITDDCKAEICYKEHYSKTERHEFEFRIDYFEGVKMYDLAKYKLEKVRYSFKPQDGLKIYCDVDVYPFGLQVVEIEYADQIKDEDIPTFCGREITGEKEFSNIEIAINQYQEG